MAKRTYTITGVHTAINLLRPQAEYALSNTEFIIWKDPRPAPSFEEIQDTINKIREFEDSIPSVELDNPKTPFDRIATHGG